MLLFQKKAWVFVEEEDMSSRWRRRHVLLLNKKKCILVEQEDMYSCWTGRHVFLPKKKTCILVEQEDMCSSSTGIHVFLFNKETFPIRWTFRIFRLARSSDFPTTQNSRFTWSYCLAFFGLGFISRFPRNILPITSRLLTSGQKDSLKSSSVEPSRLHMARSRSWARSSSVV